MLELCMSGHALNILRRSARAHTINAFIGRLMCCLGEDSSGEPFTRGRLVGSSPRQLVGSLTSGDVILRRDCPVQFSQ
jgi:hypothetical protein